MSYLTISQIWLKLLHNFARYKPPKLKKIYKIRMSKIEISCITVKRNEMCFWLMHNNMSIDKLNLTAKFHVNSAKNRRVMALWKFHDLYYFSDFPDYFFQWASLNVYWYATIKFYLSSLFVYENLLKIC